MKPEAAPLVTVRVFVAVEGVLGVRVPKSISRSEIMKEKGMSELMYWKPARTVNPAESN